MFTALLFLLLPLRTCINHLAWREHDPGKGRKRYHTAFTQCSFIQVLEQLQEHAFTCLKQMLLKYLNHNRLFLIWNGKYSEKVYERSGGRKHYWLQRSYHTAVEHQSGLTKLQCHQKAWGFPFPIHIISITATLNNASFWTAVGHLSKCNTVDSRSVTMEHAWWFPHN